MTTKHLWKVLVCVPTFAMASCGGDSPTAPTPPTLSAPTALVATPGIGQVALAWQAVTGATGYTVFRGGTQVAQVATTTYTDAGLSPDGQVCYTVRSVAGTRTSTDSGQSCATPTRDYRGSWKGNTRQGRDVLFTVVDSTIQNFQVSVDASDFQCSGNASVTFPGPINITGSTFTISSRNPTWTINGTFSSVSAVSGSLSVTVPGSQGCSALTVNVDWSASKR